MAFLARLKKQPIAIKRFYLEEIARHLADNEAALGLLVITQFLLKSARNEVLQELIEFLAEKRIQKPGDESQHQNAFLH
jgi:hypothetical protein